MIRFALTVLAVTIAATVAWQSTSRAIRRAVRSIGRTK